MGKTEEAKAQDFESAELEWVQLNKTLSKLKKVDGEGPAETGKERLIRKVKQNPFIPIGAFGTAGCLMFGLVSFVRKDSAKSQTLMRGRIAAQGFTVFAVCVGIVISAQEAIAKRALKDAAYAAEIAELAKSK